MGEGLSSRMRDGRRERGRWGRMLAVQLFSFSFILKPSSGTAFKDANILMTSWSLTIQPLSRLPLLAAVPHHDCPCSCNSSP